LRVDGLVFRRATSADIPSIVELVTMAYRGEASREGWTSEADLVGGQRVDADVLTDDIHRYDSVVILAERGDALVGCAHIERMAPGRAYFGMFAVRPAGQAQGHGKKILAEAERTAVAEWGVSVMEMTVLDLRAELLDFYQRRGYRRTGIHKAFPYGDERFGVPTRDDLRLEVLEKDLPPAL
jgi:ribosomal protein S18 acetylase RimI-like enzyme